MSEQVPTPRSPRVLARDDLLTLAAAADQAVDIVARMDWDGRTLFQMALEQQLRLAEQHTEWALKAQALDHAAVLVRFAALVKVSLGEHPSAVNLHEWALQELTRRGVRLRARPGHDDRRVQPVPRRPQPPAGRRLGQGDSTGQAARGATFTAPGRSRTRPITSTSLARPTSSRAGPARSAAPCESTTPTGSRPGRPATRPGTASSSSRRCPSGRSTLRARRSTRCCSRRRTGCGRAGLPTTARRTCVICRYCWRRPNTWPAATPLRSRRLWSSAGRRSASPTTCGPVEGDRPVRGRRWPSCSSASTATSPCSRPAWTVRTRPAGLLVALSAKQTGFAARVRAGLTLRTREIKADSTRSSSRGRSPAGRRSGTRGKPLETLRQELAQASRRCSPTRCFRRRRTSAS